MAEALPLADASLDTLTIAFGIRNATQVDLALREAFGVLKPGGRFLCLEFSTTAAWLRPVYSFFSFTVIPGLGAWIANSPEVPPEAYSYLVESIQRFRDPPAWARRVGTAGFRDVRWHDVSLGITCIHTGTRP